MHRLSSVSGLIFYLRRGGTYIELQSVRERPSVGLSWTYFFSYGTRRMRAKFEVVLQGGSSSKAVVRKQEGKAQSNPFRTGSDHDGCRKRHKDESGYRGLKARFHPLYRS